MVYGGFVRWVYTIAADDLPLQGARTSAVVALFKDSSLHVAHSLWPKVSHY